MLKYEVRVYADGAKEWYLNGKLHREDGPAVEKQNGTKEWYLNGKHHREDGPAVEVANGAKSWYLQGNLHREDGPAIEGANGTKEWFLNGKQVSESDVMDSGIEMSIEEISRELGYKIKIVRQLKHTN